MSKTTTQMVAPTVSQYDALMSPPVHLTPTQIFDYQVRCYADAGIATAEEMESLRVHMPEDGKPFLVVSSKPQIATKADLDPLIAKLTYRDERGVNYLDPQYLADEVAVPSSAYLMAEVDDGRAMLNVAPRDASVQLAEARRSPFTWWEGYCLYLCFGFALLGHHNVDCSGSRCHSKYVSTFSLFGGKPGFNCYRDGNAHPGWGSASCGSRIGA